MAYIGLWVDISYKIPSLAIFNDVAQANSTHLPSDMESQLSPMYQWFPSWPGYQNKILDFEGHVIF